MFKRAVRSAVAKGQLTPSDVAVGTDATLSVALMADDPTGLARAVQERRLHKRALDLPATEVPDDCQPWLHESPELLEQVEDRVAREAGLRPGQLLIDYPSRDSMLSVDLPLRTRGGKVERLTEAGRAGTLGLPRVADELYRSARRFRVFTSQKPNGKLAKIFGAAVLPRKEIERRLREGKALLQ